MTPVQTRAFEGILRAARKASQIPCIATLEGRVRSCSGRTRDKCAICDLRQAWNKAKKLFQD